MQPILEETYGIIVYQEQVMLIGVSVAGFSMAEADMLRKAMGKKKADVMAKMKAKFVDGAATRGMPREKASELWDKIEPFAGYGFNKSHSVAYASVAYQTAYLKAHYPVAFMAAMLNSELSSTDAIAKYTAECRAMGIALLPPDINESGWYFTVMGDQIRYGLGAIKGVGGGAIEAVLAARYKAGHFRSLAHFVSEIDLRSANRKVLECIIKAGSFDGFCTNRNAVLAGLDGALDYAQKSREAREKFQVEMFGLGVKPAIEPPLDIAVRPWPERERLRYEKEALGFFLTGNPLSEYQETLERLVSHTTGALRDGAPEGLVVLGGMVSGFNRVKIKSGANAGRFMGRFVLEDLEGGLPVTLFANKLEQFGHLLTDEAVVLVKGQVRERGSEVEITVEEIVPVKKLAGRSLNGVDLKLNPRLSTSQMLKLRDLLTEHPGDVPVTLEMQLADRTVRIVTPDNLKIQLVPALVTSIEGLLGQGSIRER